ncbi:MAG: hypothetical protein PHG84_05000 [Endomicrobiaceae bacterium]|nr:hypothetical protein [Endomicrobiaceae bacterium]MDD3922527.1 hypothetical protein [Endomicrobiaceae bacterium]
MDYELIKMALLEIRSGIKKYRQEKLLLLLQCIAVIHAIVLNLKAKVMMVIYQQKFFKMVIVLEEKYSFLKLL